MTQSIVLECGDDHVFTAKELGAIQSLANRFPNEDLRVNDDPTNIKVYIGPYYAERFRFWIDPDGLTDLVERDLGSEDDSDWQRSNLLEATLKLHQLESTTI